MTITQLRAYTEWVKDFLEWAIDGDGRVGSYDRVSKAGSPYFEELQNRENYLKAGAEQVKKNLKKKPAKPKPAKKKSPKTSKAKKPAKRVSRLNIKMSVPSRKALEAKAKRFQGGNLSAWLRRAGLEYRPDLRSKTK